MKMGQLRAGVVIAALVAVGALGVLSFGPPERARAEVAPESTIAYGWPIKPFDRAHPVRGNFGDPRTVFHGPPTADTLYHHAGSFTFHHGVDIAAPAGTEVYPVRDGRVVFVNASHVSVEGSDGTVFQYWHIGPSLRVGTFVHARTTVLGTISGSSAHVDLTEIQNGQAVNPLAPGHLTPYKDHTRPVVASIRLQSDNVGHVLFPNFVSGRVWLVTSAYDKPSPAVQGSWHGLPVTPALVTWQIKSASGRVAVPLQVAADFRTTVPDNKAFWSTYARGTFQNMAAFADHYSFLQPGSYLFLLSPTKFDTHSLPDGIYDLVVTVKDIRGNSSTRSLRFTIHNAPPAA